MRSLVAVALAALCAVPTAVAHTWIEQLRNVNAQGKYVGEYGYPRGMVSKTDPGFNGDSMNWQLPQNNAGGPFITKNTTLCHPSQQKQVQSQDKYPRLKATPGGFMAMRYMENGHVTLPNNQKGKPKKGGTVFVYGTTQPKEDEKIVDVLQWSQDGQGGDKRGVLINMNDFDDGRCYEKNGTPINIERAQSNPNFALGQVSKGPGNYPLFCETNAAVPKDAKTGEAYTLYWVWQWNTVAGADPGLPNGKDEYYSTCIDVDVVDAITQDAETEFDLGPQQDAMSVAVSDFASRTAIITNVIEHEMGPVFNSTPTASGAPKASQTTLVTSTPPFSNTSTAREIPTITQRPGAEPTETNANDVATVTVTEVKTVTAPAVTMLITARAEHIARHNSAKFRGRFNKRT